MLLLVLIYLEMIKNKVLEKKGMEISFSHMLFCIEIFRNNVTNTDEILHNSLFSLLEKLLWNSKISSSLMTSPLAENNGGACALTQSVKKYSKGSF